MAETQAAKFNVILEGEVLDLPEDSNIMRGINVDIAPAQLNAGAGAGAGLDAGLGAGAGLDAGLGADAGLDAGLGAGAGADAPVGVDEGVHQNPVIRLDRPVFVEPGEPNAQNHRGVASDTDDEQHSDHVMGSALDLEKKFSPDTEGKYHWADLLERVVDNLNVGSKGKHRVEADTKKLQNFMIQSFPMFAPLSQNPEDACQTKEMKLQDFYSIPMITSKEAADFCTNTQGDVICLSLSKFSNPDEAIRWVLDNH